MLSLGIMPVTRNHILILFCVICCSCVEPFEPVLEESQEVLVISGMISDGPGRHTVTVSLSAPYRWPDFNGMENCVVTVTDQHGNTVDYIDEGEGTYAADIPDSFLEVGDAVSLHVLTPDHGEYWSSFDTILACPDLDSVYWELQYMETPDPDISLPGIQFYLDMSGKPSDSRNIIWRVNETWEYWASLIGNFIMWDWGYMEEFWSGKVFKCWKSYPLDHIFAMSTRNLSTNEIRKMPLNFVSNKSDRLQVTYSLYVQQQSLSLEAYDYWQRMNEQVVSSGGLYEKQPASVRGNICSTDHPEELVLGFFYASQVKEQRIFVHNNNLFDFFIPHIDCEYQPLQTLWQSDNIEFPVYIYVPGPFQPLLWGPQECFDCRLQGGDTIRPKIWESWK
jgi:hypothetical protein